MSVADSQADGRRLYLLDVEGTVAPLTLTTEVLFPYARKHLAEFLKLNLRQPDIQDDLKLLAEENRAELSEESPTFGVEIRNELYARAYLMWLMDRDRKSTALKSLQGKIWKVGFGSGELKGTLFEDVPGAFTRWSARGKVAIYSSGSVEAQKLLFGHSNYGDLTPMIAGYFDTRTGAKGDAASYAAIAKAMEVEPGDSMFFSDVVRELDAAREAGFGTRLVVREGNAVVEDPHGYLTITSLGEVASK
jgi:enolase-phosphatase E1